MPNERISTNPALRLRNADDATRDSSACIAGRLSFQVVCLFVHDDSVPDDSFLAAQLHRFIREFDVRLAGSVRFDIAKIARVSLGRVGSAVIMFVWIKMTAG